MSITADREQQPSNDPNTGNNSSADRPEDAITDTDSETITMSRAELAARLREAARQAPAVESPAPANTEPRTHSRRGFLKALVGGGVVVLGGGGITAAVVGSRRGKPTTTAPVFQTPAPSPTATAPASPTAAPSTKETLSEPVSDEALINTLREMDIDAFNGRPRSERKKFIAWELVMIDQGDKTDFFNQSDQFLVPPNPSTGYPGVSLADLNPYSSVHPENAASPLDDGQKIVDHTLWFMPQVVEAQYADKSDPTGKVDNDLALKMLSGESYYNDQDGHPALTKDTYDQMAHFTKQLNKTAHLGIRERYTATDYTPVIKEGFDEEENPIKYRDVEYVSHGKTMTGRFVSDPVELNVPVFGNLTTVTIDLWPLYSSRPGKLHP